ncbi:MAG: heme biosynthesis protein HemY [Magnetovibrionaceae bacterium]
MIKALFIFAILGLLAWAGFYFGHNPGEVSIVWRGWQVETSFAVLLIGVGVLAALVALVWGFWGSLRRAPKNIRRYLGDRRRNKGYRALTQGMAAVAAGDAKAAAKFDEKAQVLLSDPPITLLLSAQAAQLAGDERRAGEAFTKMLDRSETEFLGLRGLLTQAMKRGDDEEALKLARRAVLLKPGTEWAHDVLFDLETRLGNWSSARGAVQGSVRQKLLDKPKGRRKEAVLEAQMAAALAEKGDTDAALKSAQQALKLDPSFVVPAIIKAKVYAKTGPDKKARQALDEAWSLGPRAELADLFMVRKTSQKPTEFYKSADRLANHWADHLESRLLKGRAALDADLWGEARRHLEAAVADLEKAGADLPARLCRLMAELEEAEHGDSETSRAIVRDWLIKASLGEGDPAWVCSSCGHVGGEWHAVCPQCESFDSLTWKTPAQAAPVLVSGPSAGTLPVPVTADGKALEKKEADPVPGEKSLVTTKPDPNIPVDTQKDDGPKPPPEAAHS